MTCAHSRYGTDTCTSRRSVHFLTMALLIYVMSWIYQQVPLEPHPSSLLPWHADYHTSHLSLTSGKWHLNKDLRITQGPTADTIPRADNPKLQCTLTQDYFWHQIHVYAELSSHHSSVDNKLKLLLMFLTHKKIGRGLNEKKKEKDTDSSF